MNNPSFHRSPAAAVIFTCGLLLGAGAFSQPSADEVFVERIDVPLVNVEVWVTDARGNPVTGLETRNFEVREDGQPVKISHFSEVTEESAFLDVAPTNSPTPAADATYRDLQRPAPAATTHLVLFFDDANTDAANRTQLVEELRGFIDRQDVPAERILLLSFGESLEVNASFGSSVEQLQTALDDIAKSATRGTLEAGARRLELAGLQQNWVDAQQLAGGRGDPCDLFLRRGRASVESWAKTRKQQLLRTLDALESTATLISGIPGLKTVVYASDGLELSPGGDLIAFMDSVCPARPDLLQMREFLGEMTDPMQTLSRHANSNRVTFYTLQASGLRTARSAAADSSSLDVRTVGRIASATRENLREGSELLASETGGRAFANRSDFSAQLGEVANELRSYYSIAFAPNHGGDGGDHEIDVRILGVGGDVRIRHRGSYHDKSEEERLAEQLESVLFLGDASNPLGVRLGAGELVPSAQGRFVLPLHIVVPAEQVTFLPTAGSDSGRLLAQVGLRDGKNRTVVAPSQAYPVTRPEEGSDSFTLRMELEVAPGPQVLGIAVRDQLSFETSLVTTTINVPPPAGTEKGKRRRGRG